MMLVIVNWPDKAKKRTINNVQGVCEEPILPFLASRLVTRHRENYVVW
jgi:hypothetical protein